jgi:hypothetical protein
MLHTVTSSRRFVHSLRRTELVWSRADFLRRFFPLPRHLRRFLSFLPFPFVNHLTLFVHPRSRPPRRRHSRSQFLSARTNLRTDNYGGSIENRSRFLFEILDEIKKQVPSDFLLSIKINSADFSDGGMTAEESQYVCEKLDAAGIDLLELSGGTYEVRFSPSPSLQPFTHAPLCTANWLRAQEGVD